MKDLQSFLEELKAYYAELDAYSKGKLLAEFSYEVMQDLEHNPDVGELWVMSGIGDDIGVNLSVISDILFDYVLGIEEEKAHDRFKKS